MLDETKIEKRVEIEEFIGFIAKYEETQFECTKHTFFRLSEKQRKILNCEELVKVLTKEKPFLVGLQYNKSYAAFYKYQDKNLKIMVALD